MSRRSSAASLAALAALSLALLTACVSAGGTAAESAGPKALKPSMHDESGSPVAGDAWVVVMFEDRESEFDVGLMDLLLETELAADEALGEADAGWIDGNDVGDHGYELYFVGDDPEEMWRVLEPVFADAPVLWTRVELRAGLEDPSPQVLTQE